ncbi:hypothetical protein D917_08644 [Trichinella nativa]|uniref:Uncharacterized protein n=1 Tax=Trichinella nativa TaxID=6335 RepID=A0A1Y3EIX8_9BILA|nr:hypothetical protein D917_08644 [Trichinella nativa]
MIRDAFINNMSSNEIRTRLLEHSVISLQETVNKAMALNSAKENAKLYTKSDPIINSNATFAGNGDIRVLIALRETPRVITVGK